jgi:hypothetical protein
MQLNKAVWDSKDLQKKDVMILSIIFTRLHVRCTCTITSLINQCKVMHRATFWFTAGITYIHVYT